MWVVLGTVSSGESQQGPCAPHEVWKVRVSSVSHPLHTEPEPHWGLAESVRFSVGSSQPFETLSQSSQESYGTAWLQLFSGRTHHFPRWAVGPHAAPQGAASRLCPQHSSASFVHTDNMQARGGPRHRIDRRAVLFRKHLLHFPCEHAPDIKRPLGRACCHVTAIRAGGDSERAKLQTSDLT